MSAEITATVVVALWVTSPVRWAFQPSMEDARFLWSTPWRVNTAIMVIERSCAPGVRVA